MNSVKVIQDFFEEYAQAALSGDVEKIANAYAETYIESGPKRVVVYHVDAGYREVLEKKTAAMKEQLGLVDISVKVADVREFAPLHCMVDCQWTMRFKQPSKEEIESTFMITYTVRIESEQPVILSYVSHEDEEAVMKRDGVI